MIGYPAKVRLAQVRGKVVHATEHLFGSSNVGRLEQCPLPLPCCCPGYLEFSKLVGQRAKFGGHCKPFLQCCRIADGGRIVGKRLCEDCTVTASPRQYHSPA